MKVSGKIKAIRVITKRNGVVVADAKKGIVCILESPIKLPQGVVDAISFNKGLLDSIAESNFVSGTVAGMSLPGSTIVCDCTHHTAGQPVLDDKGQPVLENGVPRVYTTTGFRYNNIEIDLNLSKATNASGLIEAMERSKAYAASLKTVNELPSVATLQEGKVTEDVQEPEVIETTAPALADIAASMTEETPEA